MGLALHYGSPSLGDGASGHSTRADRSVGWTAMKSRLLTCFNLGGDEADVVDARATHDVDGPRDLGELDVVITFYESDLVSALLENFEETRAEIIPVARVLIDQHFSAGHHLNHDGAIIGFSLFLIGRRRLRNQSLQSCRRPGSDHYEDNDQNQEHVYQRNDIGFRNRTVFTSTNCHPHRR